ncbi:MAG: NADH-quinone oxidoreductase subunit L [Anaerolineae bacterium]|nr:NADH-quinone oxidoreductase subunit L [Anaerolineae bacterium]
MTALLIAFVICLPWVGAISVVLVGDKRPKAQHMLAVVFAAAAGLAALILLSFASTNSAISIPMGGVFGDFTFVPDGLGVFLAAVAAVIGCLAVIFSVDYMAGEAQLGRYYFLMLLFIGAMCGLVLTGSLLLLFIFWEITALCSYALISFHNDDPKAVAGGIKALVITQIGGVGLLIGVLIAYAQLKSYDINNLLANAHTLPVGDLSFIAFGFLLAAAAKSAQIPFHTWLPGAMEAPTPVSALIHAATMVNAGVYLLARFYPAFAPVPGWTDIVTIVGVLSALLGALMALVATDLKRVLAYSTISQLGYMVYAIGIGALYASQFHLLSHAVFKALLFLCAGAVIHTIGTRDLRQMGGLGRQMPFVRNVFIVGALALAGLPFANGFWSKELLLEIGIKDAVWAFVIMLIGVGLTAAYSIRVVWLVFFGEQRTAYRVHDPAAAMKISLTILALGTLTSWLLAGSLGELLQNMPPFYQFNAETTLELVNTILSAPVTWGVLVVIAFALAIWHWRAPLTAVSDRLQFIARAAAVDFGFEWLNRQFMKGAQRTAIALRQTQTGQLNWNVVGIVGGLVMVLLILVIGR